MPMRGERWRFWAPVALLIALAGYAGQKLVRSHLDKGTSAPDTNYTFKRSLPAPRGSIYGAYGKDSPLAKSVPFWEYRLDPVDLTNAVVKPRGEPRRSKDAIVKTIADMLHLNYAKVRAMSENTKNCYQFLSISADSDAHAVLANRRVVSGLAIQDKQVRKYLCGRSMAHILGSTNAKDEGTCGIELRFNRELTGVPGVIQGMKDAKGRELFDKRMVSIKPKPGADIYLTIDPNVQFEAEEALKWGLTEFGASSGWAIVMDSATGAIHAMVSLPDFHPVNFGSASESAKMNRAIAFNYEPGSVMKVLPVAAAIDSDPRRYGPNTIYRTNRDDDRYYKLPGDGSHVWEPTMTLTHAIVHSSNIVIGKLAYDLGP